MIKFYGYDNCDTCRKAKKQLKAWGVDFQDIDITKKPPSKKALAALLADAAHALTDLFNRSGQEYRKLDMKTKLPTLSQAQALALLAENGRLVKRPIVTDGARHTVGFKPERFAEVWKP
ncbi:MAG: Spx/MgsR family RNA polymerase-binding regulatory protein [Myxococcales bacterium]|nr:Spx/MgsR family RNA polymerase-binding regulatory protein [Myxococcales bacterium]